MHENAETRGTGKSTWKKRTFNFMASQAITLLVLALVQVLILIAYNEVNKNVY